MSYTILPNTGDTLGSTKVAINTNFSLIQTTMKQNHFGMGEANAGKHKIIQLVGQASAAQTAVGESALYTKSASNGDIYARSPNHVDPAPSGEYQLTTFSDANIAKFGTNALVGLVNDGWTFLPGGLLMQYGRLGITSSGEKTITFPIPFTLATFTPVITLGLQSAVGYISLASVASTDFKVTITSLVGAAGGIYWTAIGKP